MFPISISFPGPTKLFHFLSRRLGNVGFRASFMRVRPMQLNGVPTPKDPMLRRAPYLV